MNNIACHRIISCSTQPTAFLLGQVKLHYAIKMQRCSTLFSALCTSAQLSSIKIYFFACLTRCSTFDYIHHIFVIFAVNVCVTQQLILNDSAPLFYLSSTRRSVPCFMFVPSTSSSLFHCRFLFLYLRYITGTFLFWHCFLRDFFKTTYSILCLL